LNDGDEVVGITDGLLVGEAVVTDVGFLEGVEIGLFVGV